jgi:hypothetical protein
MSLTLAEVEALLTPFADETLPLTDWTWVPGGREPGGAILPDRAVWDTDDGALTIEAWWTGPFMRVVGMDGANYEFPLESVPGTVVRLLGR